MVSLTGATAGTRSLPDTPGSGLSSRGLIQRSYSHCWGWLCSCKPYLWWQVRKTTAASRRWRSSVPSVGKPCGRSAAFLDLSHWSCPGLGFLLATAPFFAVLMILFGERRPIHVADVRIAWPSRRRLYTYCSATDLGVFLPRGVLPDLSVSCSDEPRYLNAGLEPGEPDAGPCSAVDRRSALLLGLVVGMIPGMTISPPALSLPCYR